MLRSIPRAPAAPALHRELILQGMARALGCVPKLADPYARRSALARAGFRDPDVADDLAAAAIARLKRRACGEAAA